MPVWRGGGREMVGVQDLLSRVSSALDGEERSGRRKWLAGGASILVVGAVLWPVTQHWREVQRDGFPLSHYPMFTAKRSATVKVTHLVGIDAAGGRHRLPYIYAGSGGLNQVRRQINRAVREGRSEALCESVAARIARQQEGPLGQVVRVQLVIGKYSLADYFAGETRPVSENVLASSEIERNAA